MDPVDVPGEGPWLEAHLADLISFGRHAVGPDGRAQWLNTDGTADARRPSTVYQTARMAHVFGLADLAGRPDSRVRAQAALGAITAVFADPEHRGWFGSVQPDGTASSGKSCYDHAFVLLAAATGVQAGLDGAADLLDEAGAVFLSRFWDDAPGLCRDSWDTSWTVLDPYRGLNSNMHSVEAMLAVADATGDRAWLGRALRVCRFVAAIAAEHGWRLPEHFDNSWNPLLEYNRDVPTDPFKPFGATVGHGFEWARLLLHTQAAAGPDPSLVEAASHLYTRAAADGWAADGNPGFVYTTDFDGTPVVTDRLHWVAAEAVNTASCLARATGDSSAEADYRSWWDYIARYVIDHVDGGWFHQLDSANRPAASIWPGKPDLYHAVQATLIPRLPLAPGLAAALRQKASAA